MTPSVYDPGLQSITVAETALSEVDGEAGRLVVRGYPIEELAVNAAYEESVYLLLHGDLPSADELAEFRAALSDRRAIGDAVHTVLEAAATEDCDAMDAIRIGVAAASLGTADDAPLSVAKRLIAVAPTIVATYWRYRQGKEPIPPNAELGHAANYWYMLSGSEPTDPEASGMDVFLTTIIDHGLNPSTFTARTVVSTESDLVSAATAAVGALKGRRHGGRLGPVADMLQEAHEAEDVETYVRERLDSEEFLPGFGHRIYQVRDPRAAVLSAATERFSGATERPSDDGRAPFLDTVSDLQTVGEGALASRYPQRRTAATVEFYAVALLRAIGIPRDLFTATFAVSRVGGWMAHCLEQLEDNELVRPVSRYVGETDRSWTPLDQR